jgi:hypothetical protein
MANAAWETMHEEGTEASRDFAWRYRADVANWDDPPATFELHGQGAHALAGRKEQGIAGANRDGPRAFRAPVAKPG